MMNTDSVPYLYILYQTEQNQHESVAAREVVTRRRGSVITVEVCGREEHKFEGTVAASEVQEYCYED